MQTLSRTGLFGRWIARRAPATGARWRLGIATLVLAAGGLAAAEVLADDLQGGGGKWAASWATAIQAAYGALTAP